MQWDDDRWRGRGDNTWAAGCRWMQSRWREEILGLEPGPRVPSDPERLVCSMLPVDADPRHNFLSDAGFRAAMARLKQPASGGIFDADRVQRNLLTSQVACLNLFGPFADAPRDLTPWVRTLDESCQDVTALRFEWAPPREEHFNGGSAFDVLVDYSTRTGRRFLGVECKYAENLSRSGITVRDVYRTFTRDSGEWRDEAERRLDLPSLRQFWLNTLLVQSLVQRGDGYEAGMGIVVACAADRVARVATHRVRGELHDPNRWLRWMPYEAVLAALPRADWIGSFRERYLEFGAVGHKLNGDDPRLNVPEIRTGGIQDALSSGMRVLGGGSVLEQIVEAIADGRLDRSIAEELEALDTRAGELAIDLRTLRQSAHDIWDRIEDPH